MAIVLSTVWFYILVGIAVVFPLFSIVITMSVFKQVPWAWTMYRCFKNNLPCIMQHYPKGGVEIAMPELEKDLKAGVPQTFFSVPKWGIKLPDIAGDNTELLMGKLRIIHYFKNNVSPTNIIDVVAIDRLKEWLNGKGVNVQNKEDIITFFLNDYVKTKDIIGTIEGSSVDDEETKRFIINTIKVIEANRKELEALRMRDGIFVWQSAMMALDRAIAFTSAAFANAKSAIEAQVRAKQLEDKNKEMYRTVLIIFVGLICAAIAYAIISKAGGLF